MPVDIKDVQENDKQVPQIVISNKKLRLDAGIYEKPGDLVDLDIARDDCTYEEFERISKQLVVSMFGYFYEKVFSKEPPQKLDEDDSDPLRRTLEHEKRIWLTNNTRDSGALGPIENAFKNKRGDFGFYLMLFKISILGDYKNTDNRRIIIINEALGVIQELMGSNADTKIFIEKAIKEYGDANEENVIDKIVDQINTRSTNSLTG
jgi:hypothetical protein